MIPPDSNTPYDMREIITRVVDEASVAALLLCRSAALLIGVMRGLASQDNFFELMPDFASNLIIGFGRMEGQTVGIVANQVRARALCL